MNRKYKMISFDLDDTLLKSDKTIPNDTVAWIKRYRKDGGIVVLASGRDISEMTDFVSLLGMKTGESGYVISSSGAYLWDLKRNNITEFDSFTPHEAKILTEALLAQDSRTLPMIVCKKTNYIVTLNPTPKERLRFAYYRLRGNTRRLVTLKEVEEITDYIEKVRVKKTSHIDYSACLRNMANTHFRLIEGHQIDYFRNGVDKSSGIKKALELDGIRVEDILIFGDDENDITCFEAFPNTVAMTNSVPPILQIAKHITESNECNGVLKFLLREHV